MSTHGRKLIVFTTVAAMIFSMVGMAFASHSTGSEFDDVAAGSAVAADFNLLFELEVFEGYPNGTVGPDDTLTRAEFAAVAVRAAGNAGTADSVAEEEPDFADDIPEWAWGWVNAAVAFDYVEGYPDGTFRPDAEISYAEAVTVLVRILGYGDFVSEGDWPLSYIAKASDLGLNAGVSVPASDAILRSEMAMLTANALKTDPADEDGNPAGHMLVEDSFPGFDAGHIQESTAAGTFEEYLSASDRIEVSGETYDLAGSVGVTFNGGDELNFPAGVNVSNDVEGEAVELTLDADDEVTGIAVTRTDGPGVVFDGATAASGETHYGSIDADNSVVGTVYNDISVDESTTMMLDGEEVNVAELEDADVGGEATVVYRISGSDVNPDIAEFGDAEKGPYATYVAVATGNTIAGEIATTGSDAEGTWVTLEDESGDETQVYYDDSAVGPYSGGDIGTEVEFVLNGDGVAVDTVGPPGVQVQYFFGILQSFSTSGTAVTATFELADGSTETVTDDDGWDGPEAPPSGTAGDSVFAVDVQGAATVQSDEDPVTNTETVNDVTSSYVDLDTAGATPFSSAGVIVYDNDADAFGDVSDIESGDSLQYALNMAGAIGYVVINP